MDERNPLPTEPNAEHLGHEEEYDVPTPSERVIAAFIKPSRAFVNLRLSRPWPIFFTAMAVIIIVGICSSLLMTSSDEWKRSQEEMMLSQIDKIESDDDLSREEKETAIEVMEFTGKFTKWLMIFGQIIFTPIILFASGLVLLMVMSLTGNQSGAPVNYMEALKVASLGGVVAAVGRLIFVLIGLLLNDPQFHGGITDIIETESMFASVVSASMGLPMLWAIFVEGKGTSELTRTDIAKNWLLIALASIIIAVLFGMLTMISGAPTGM